MCSCSTISTNKGASTQTSAFVADKFKKICLEGSGKGRIELVGSKYTFAYESQINRVKNLFELALDFPIIGETRVSLSLNPKEVSKKINHTELVEMLKEKLEQRADRDQIVKTIEEFFVFASDFIRYKASGSYPISFLSSFENNHFILARETFLYNFQVDNFSENQIYFERTVFKIFLKSSSVIDPILTLFLVPQSCD